MLTLLNIIKIIYSYVIVNRYNSIEIDSEIISKIIETHNTSNLNNYEAIMWIEYIKKLGKCSKWNKYEMYREWLYHKNLYKYNLFPTHTDYVDFEETQTIKTYILRFIGNCVY